jgi:hypothetical protein
MVSRVFFMCLPRDVRSKTMKMRKTAKGIVHIIIFGRKKLNFSNESPRLLPVTFQDCQLLLK